MIDKRKPKPKRFPLQYILHKLPRFGMSADHYKCSRYRLVVDTQLPSEHKRRQFTRIIHFRWPKAEVSWMKGRMMVDLTKDRYKPAKGSWLEEKERREDEQARQALLPNDGSGSDTEDTEHGGAEDVRFRAILYRKGRDPSPVPGSQSDGSRDQAEARGEEQR